MSDTENTTESKAENKKTVADDMKSRRVFANVDEASAYLNKCAEDFSDFDKMVLAAPGVDENGDFNSEVYTSDMEVMVATLRKAKEGVKAIVVAPVPSLESLLANDAGKAFVQEIIYKELNHRAVRLLRDADDVSVMVDQMPTTLVAYVESSRGDAGILESFNELYKGINQALASKLPIWAKARLAKADFRKAMESKGYASEYFPALEDYKGQSLFVAALELSIKAAKRKGMDSTIFERWLSTRDQKAFTSDEDEDFDIDSLTDSLLEETDDKPADSE